MAEERLNNGCAKEVMDALCNSCPHRAVCVDVKTYYNTVEILENEGTIDFSTLETKIDTLLLNMQTVDNNVDNLQKTITELETTINSDMTVIKRKLNRILKLVNQDVETEEWQVGVQYYVNDIVIYNEKDYICILEHVSQSDWTPDCTPTLWNTYLNTTELTTMDFNTESDILPSNDVYEVKKGFMGKQKIVKVKNKRKGE